MKVQGNGKEEAHKCVELLKEKLSEYKAMRTAKTTVEIII